MVAIAEKFKNKLTKKTFACPSCSKQMRVPIKPGKVLMVTCPRCQGQIQLSFKSPLSELFQWEKGRTFSYNLRMLSWRFKSLPFQFKISMVLQIVLLGLLIQWLLAPSADKAPEAIEPLKKDSSYVREI